MGDFTEIPLPPVQNDIDIFWPVASSVFNNGDPFDTGAADRYSSRSPGALWGAKVGGGFNGMTRDAQGGFVGQFASAPLGQVVSRDVTGFNVHVPLLAGGPAGFQYPSCARVWRVQFVLNLFAPVLASAALKTYIVFENNGAGGPGAAGNGYAGITLDTDGAWKWVARNGTLAGFGLSEGPLAIGLPGTVTPAIVDFVWLAATATANAQFQLFLNGRYSTPVIQRAWGTGTVLPGYATNATPNGTGFYMTFGATDTLATVGLQFGYLRCSAGQYLPNGVPLQ